MFTSQQLVNFCLSMIGMPYWYGTCVYKCSTSMLNSKSKQYPDHYKSDRTARYKDDIAKKKVSMDCVGMIKGFFWTNGGQGVRDYIEGKGDFTNKYGSNGCPDKSANGMLDWCKSKKAKWGSINTLPEVPGILLFKAGHVGVYIGNGYAVEAQGFAYGVKKTKVSSRSWVTWAYLPDSILDYSSSTPIVPTPTPTPEPTPAPKVNINNLIKAVKTNKQILKYKSPMMKSTAILEMQTALNLLGYNCGTADGIFGSKTKTGVKAFQKAQKLEADGEFGPLSLAALQKLL